MLLQQFHAKMGRMKEYIFHFANAYSRLKGVKWTKVTCLWVAPMEETESTDSKFSTLLSRWDYHISQECFQCCITWFSAIYLYTSEKNVLLLNIANNYQVLIVITVEIFTKWHTDISARKDEERFISCVCHKSTFFSLSLVRQWNC